MKRYIVINTKRTAIVVSDNFCSAVYQIAKDTNIGDEIFVFDTSLHICYSYKRVSNGYELQEQEIEVSKFRNFMKGYEVPSEMYKALIISITK